MATRSRRDWLIGPSGYTFNPPSFTGLPFSVAAFLQGATYTFSQTISEFEPGVLYRLSFYLGSRYSGGSYDGNQTVVALIDGRAIGNWALASFKPFTLQSAYFRVETGGTHQLQFAGINSGDHTVFLSGVSIEGIAQ